MKITFTKPQNDVNPYIKPLAVRSSGYGYIIEKNTYKICYVNPPLLAKLNGLEQDFIGKLCYKEIFKRNSPCTFCKKDITPLNKTLEWYLHDTLFDEHYVISSFLTSKGMSEYFLQTKTCITDEIKQIDKLKLSIEAEQMVTTCANTLFKEDTSLPKLLDILKSFYNSKNTYIVTSNEASKFLNNLYTSNSNNGFELINQNCFNNIDNLHNIFDKNEFIFHKFAQFKDSKLKYLICDDLKYSNIFITDIKINNDIVALLILEDCQKNITQLSKINTIKSFIGHSILSKLMMHTLDEQNTLANVILSCVQTLESSNSHIDAVHGLLDVLCDYFEGDRAYLLKSNGVFTDIEYQKCYFNCTEILDVKINTCQITNLYENFGENNAISINADFFDLKTISLFAKNNVSSVIGVRIFEKGELCRFLFVDNPKINTEKYELIQNIAFFIQSHLTKENLLGKLEQLSYIDTLTGLYNRNYYSKYIENRSKNNDINLGIIFADVNGLKRANDNFGHEYGDILIKWCADFIKNELGGVVFRIGGDEIVCFLEDISNDEYAFKIQHLSEKINNFEFSLFSFGCKHCCSGFNLSNEMKNVDLLMYENKKAYYKVKTLDTRTVKQELLDYKKYIENLREYNV